MYVRDGERQSSVAMKQAVCAGLLGLFVIFVLVEAGLPAGDKPCHQKTCKSMQYCAEPHGYCEDCGAVCNPKNNNYQKDICEQQCQDYIHVQTFLTRDEYSGGQDMSGKVAKLTVLVTVTLVVVVLVLLVLLAMLFLLYRYRRQKGPPEYAKSQGLENGKAGGVLKINMPPPSTIAPPPVTPATTSTPLSTRPRYPKEDPTLEYGAYDNPALAPSPVMENNETTPTATTTPVSRRQESSF